jgi:DNA replicative helicase MCM subunit Mcm2 (Cdc46/Mcm family)
MIGIHREKDNAILKKYNKKTLRFYISVARKIRPMLNNEAAKKLRECYINVRKSCK